MPATADAAKTIAKTDQPAHLTQRFLFHKADLSAALGTPDFYIQMLSIGLALTVAWLLSVLVRKRIHRYLQKHPPKRIDAEFIEKPLSLIGPLLALLLAGIVMPFATQYAGDVDLTNSILELCMAYLLAKTVLLIVLSRPVAYFIASVIMVVAALRATGFIHSTVSYLGSTGFDIGQFHLSMLNLTHGVVILVVVFWIAGALSRTLESYLRRTSGLSYSARELTVKFFRIFVYFSAFMITLSALGVDLTALAVFGGALGVGIGLGLQRLTANFVSGITLLLEKSIKIGDLIEVGGNTGWVRQLNIRYALVETFDGRELLIPNEELVSTRVTNWTYSNDLARVEIKIVVPFDTDPAKARELLLAAAREHKTVLKNPPPNCYLNEFAEHGFLFLLHIWVPDIKAGRLSPQSEVMFAIADKFRQNNIPLAEKNVFSLQAPPFTVS